MKFEVYDEAATLFPIGFAFGTLELPNWDRISAILPIHAIDRTASGDVLGYLYEQTHHCSDFVFS